MKCACAVRPIRWACELLPSAVDTDAVCTQTKQLLTSRLWIDSVRMSHTTASKLDTRILDPVLYVCVGVGGWVGESVCVCVRAPNDNAFNCPYFFNPVSAKTKID